MKALKFTRLSVPEDRDKDFIDKVMGATWELPILASSSTDGYWDYWDIFANEYLLDPKDPRSGLNTSGSPITDIYKVRVADDDLQGYLPDKLKAATTSGVLLTQSGTSNKTLNLSLNIQESASSGSTLLKDSKTLKKITSLDGSVVVTPSADGNSLDLKAGEIEVAVYQLYNDTGIIIKEGAPLHLVSVFDVGGIKYPTFELAQSNRHETCQGTIVVALEDIPINSLGKYEYHADDLAIDTSNLEAGKPIFISALVAGTYTTDEAEVAFPNHSIQMGGAKDSAIDGHIFVNQTTDSYDIFNRGWDGSIIESFDFRVSSDGTTVTGTLKNINNTRDLTPILGDNFTFDTTSTSAVNTITLVPGTDSNTQTNYVYIPKSTKLLTVSTSGLPTDESFCEIATLEVQSATNVQSVGGARKNQNTNNHIAKENDNGALNHIRSWIRKQYATINPTTGGGEVILDATAQNGYLTSTAATITQMHEQTIPTITMPTSEVLIKNDFTTAYRSTDNLNTIDSFSDGSTWNNAYGKIVVWLIGNKTGEPSFLCVNLPSDGENSEESALKDNNTYADYSIPYDYKSNAVLLGAFVIRLSNGALTYNGASTGYQDLRGSLPITVAGVSGGGGVTTLLALSDILETTYTGNENKLVKVNSLGTGAEFSSVKIDDLGNISTAGRGSFGGIVELNSPNATTASQITHKINGVDKWYQFTSTTSGSHAFKSILDKLIIFTQDAGISAAGGVSTDGGANYLKTKILTGTFDSNSEFSPIAHGLDSTKIIGGEVSVISASGGFSIGGISWTTTNVGVFVFDDSLSLPNENITITIRYTA